MTALSLSQNYTAIGPGLIASFLGLGGTPPYSYATRPNGAGGSINSSTGVYTSPSVVPSNPAIQYDYINVTDSLGSKAQASILIGTPLLLFCDIIQTELGLATGRVYIWDQKIFQPTDSNLYIAVSVLNPKPFGNSSTIDSSGNEVQSLNMYVTLGIDIMSRDTEALNRKEEVIMALQSIYARQQQEANSFYIGKISTSFVNLSSVDGAAIPYRYHIDVAMQYFVTKTQPAEYYDSFSAASITVEG